MVQTLLKDYIAQLDLDRFHEERGRMRGLAAVVFDLDGTIVEFKIDYVKARREAIAEIKRLHLLPERMLSERESLFKLYETVRGMKSMRPEILFRLREVILQTADTHELDAARRTGLISGARETLREMRRLKLKLGLCTIAGAKSMNVILERFGLRELFDACVSRDDVIRLKPNPEHLQEAFNRLGVVAGESAVVGDSYSDAIAARRLGALAVGVTTGLSTREQLEAAGAEIVLKSIADLPPVIKRFTSTL